MSQPDEIHACAFCGDEHPRRVACPFREPEPDRICPGCEGDGRCHCDLCPGTHSSCEWCDGAGTYMMTHLARLERATALAAPEDLLDAHRRRVLPEISGRQIDLFSRLNGSRA